MGIEIIENTPALIVDRKTLIVSDLHYGRVFIRDIKTLNEVLSYETKKLLNLVMLYKPKTIIINGDLKEALGKPHKAISEHINILLEKLLSHVREIIIVRGNHDGKLDEMLKQYILTSVKITAEETISVSGSNVLVSHGHRKLDYEELSRVDIVISGHIHPALKIVGNALRVKCWAMFDVLLRQNDVSKKVKWILMPAFSSFISGITLNELSKSEMILLSPFPGNLSQIFKKHFLLLDLTPLD